MSMLDRRRPYGETWGAGGISGYEQDGCQFHLDGRPLGGASASEVRVSPAASGRTRRPMTEEERQRASANLAKARAVRDANAAARNGDVSREASPEQSGRSDAELKALVEIAGGEWTDRAAALEFLDEEG